MTELKKFGIKLTTLQFKYHKKEIQFKEYYSIILKNLCCVKKLVLTIEKGGKSEKLYVGREGFSVNRGGLNTINIKHLSFKKYIKLIDENLEIILPNLTKSKQKKLKRFMQKVYLYLDVPFVADSFPTSSNYLLSLTEELHLINWGLDPKIEDLKILNQRFPQINLKEHLKELVKTKKKELDNFTKYLNDLDSKFSTYIKSILMLRELRKENGN